MPYISNTEAVVGTDSNAASGQKYMQLPLRVPHNSPANSIDPIFLLLQTGTSFCYILIQCSSRHSMKHSSQEGSKRCGSKCLYWVA